MGATQEKFQQRLTEIEDALDTLDEVQIMKDFDQVRQIFHQVELYDCSLILLSNKYGVGIRNRNDLRRILEESDDLWIVPADVHY